MILRFKSTLIAVVLLCLYGQGATAQVFVFRDFNQELLALVANVAEGYEVKYEDFDGEEFEGFWDIYPKLRGWLSDTEAVKILRELLDKEVVTRNELPALGIVYSKGFDSFRQDYRVPAFMSPTNGATPYVERFVESLKELASDERFTSYIGGSYNSDYQSAIDEAEDIFDETGIVIGIMEDMLGIPPPVNFLNFFTYLSKPREKYIGAVEKADGSRVTYMVSGTWHNLMYTDLWFDIFPDIFLDLYALSIIDNAVAANPGYDSEFYRLYTARVREVAESREELYTDIESYMLANAAHGLTAFMFGYIGNAQYEGRILDAYGDYYLYIEQISGILSKYFGASGQSFYEFFPRIFEYLHPAD